MNEKLLNQEDFFQKYNIKNEDFVSTGYTWDDLSKIYKDYISELPKLEDSAVYIFQRLMKIKDIHSVRYRTKDPEHLIEKIIRKKINTPEIQNVTPEDYKERITDLIGLRALHLFKEDSLPIHMEIQKAWDFKEKPVVNYRQGDPDEYIHWFVANECEKKEHKFGYRSIHYIIETKPTKQVYYAEVQVRTIFEEAWSEIDHTIRYPYDQDNQLIGQFLMILNRLAGSADEMGTFIQLLRGSIAEKERKHREEINERDKIIEELTSKINASNIKKSERETIIRSLEELKPRHDTLFDKMILKSDLNEVFSQMDSFNNLNKILSSNFDIGSLSNSLQSVANFAYLNPQIDKNIIKKSKTEKKETAVQFVVPSPGNSITQSDVKNNQVRITKDFKQYFPAESGNIKIVIDKEYECSFVHRMDRSHILRLGKDAAAELGLTAGCSLKFIKLDDRQFKLELNQN